MKNLEDGIQRLSQTIAEIFISLCDNNELDRLKNLPKEAVNISFVPLPPEIITYEKNEKKFVNGLLFDKILEATCSKILEQRKEIGAEYLAPLISVWIAGVFLDDAKIKFFFESCPTKCSN